MLIKMNKLKYYILGLLCFADISTAIALTPKEVVQSFGNNLTEWCKTGNITYRNKVEALCDGVKKCRVEDKIHTDYQLARGLRNYETFVLASYLNMFHTEMKNGLRFRISDIEVCEQDEMSEGQKLTFLTATIDISGPVNKQVKDLFLVRDDKISGIYSYDSQLGFSHLYGSLIKELEFGRYRETFGFDNGYAKVYNESGYAGLIDIKGNVVIPCIWAEMFYFGGEFATGTDGNIMTTYDLRYGGKMIPENKINYLNYGQCSNKFSEGFMRVSSKNDKWGFLSEEDPEYNISYDYDFVTDFKDGYAFVIKNGVEHIIDKNFRTILTSNDKYIIYYNAKEGLVSVTDPETEKYGFVDLEGNIKISCIFDRTGDFSDGLCVIHNERHPDYSSIENTYGYIDTNGMKVIPEIFNSCAFSFVYNEWDFINGYAIAKIIKNGKQHATFIGKNGKPLNGFDWENQDIRRISCGLAAFKDHTNKRGFYNSKGEKVIPAKYDHVQDFKENIAVVAREVNGKLLHGCINTDGVEIIPLIYDDIEDFENGVALVQLNGEMGLIDRYGNNSFKQK